MKGLFGLEEKLKSCGSENCYISEITLAELKFGVENSVKPDQNRINLNKFLSSMQIIPIYDTLDIYAKEKTRLRKNGSVIDDFDLLIGSAAITHNLTMVTNNTQHFNRLNGILLEDWTK